MEAEQIAVVCHEANRALCAQQGDGVQKPWAEAEPWQRERSVKLVRYVMKYSDRMSAESLHGAWMIEKLDAGWTYGPAKDSVAKTHPGLVPFHDLPAGQQAKDRLFIAIVKALS